MNNVNKMNILQLKNRELRVCLKLTAFSFILAFTVILITEADFKTALAGEEKSISDVESRLKKLEDREEIRQLLLDYGHFLDQGDFRSFSELFEGTEGEWVGGMGRARGATAIRNLMERSIGKNTSPGSSYHLFTNEMIHIDGDRASALTKWVFVFADESNHPRLYFLGHYEDSIIRKDGRWKFLRRVVHGDIPTDDQAAREK